VRSSIPLGHRLRLFGVFSRLVLLYNTAVSALGVSTLLALRAAGMIGAGAGASPAAGAVGSGAAEPAPDTVRDLVSGEGRFALIMGGMLLMTLGHWLGVLMVNLVHHNEYPLYRAGGWGRADLWFASWLIGVVVGALVLLAGAL
jgi:hypothetical protein